MDVRDRHLLAIAQRSTDGEIDGPGSFRHMPAHDCRVQFDDLSVGQLLPQSPGDFVNLGHDNQSRRLFIETMDDSGTHTLGAVVRRKVAETIQQCVDEGMIGISRGGMHDQAGGLVDDGQIFVFVDDIEGNIFG